MEPPPKKLLDQVRDAIRLKHYSYRTEQSCVQLLYGSGLRLNEGLRLRVKDLDFGQRQIVVRDTKGNESRVTMLPSRLIEPLGQHLQRVKQLHHLDLDQGYGSVYLPFALERKYSHADRSWIWQLNP
jgi:integrase